MHVSILKRVRRPGISMQALRAMVRHTLRRERASARAEVSVVLVGDATIRRLNRRYLKADRVTDVLAFPADHAARDRHVLGDIVISVDRARVQARTVGHPVRTEVALLAVHGVLHLLDYTDRTPHGADVMMRRQRQLLAERGLEVRG